MPKSTLIRWVRLLALSALAATVLYGEDITGTVIVKKKMTKHRVTASVSMYERGPAVELGKDRETDDPIAFERSRVVVYIEGDGLAAAQPVRESMVQSGWRFEPDLVVIPAGSSVSFPNMDPIFHNVFSLSRAKSFDLGNYPKGDTRVVTFNKPGTVYVDCHLHPNMAGTIMVTPNRWYSRVDAAGQFSLRDVPPGTYSVVAWHKAAGIVRKSIEVTAGRTPSVEFVVPITDEGPNLRAEK